MSLTGPLAIEPVMQRLASEVPALNKVEGSAEFAASFRQAPANPPVAFVLLATERAGNVVGSTQRFRQLVTAQFAVVTVVQDYKAAERGTAKAADLAALLAAERAALLNWAHPEANRSVAQLAGTGKVIRYQNGKLWWADNYAIDYRIDLS